MHSCLCSYGTASAGLRKSNEFMPIVFILSPGADPQSDPSSAAAQRAHLTPTRNLGELMMFGDPYVVLRRTSSGADMPAMVSWL